ncbi:hypothetical protein TWF281_003615 [Arthrobotrys megalospora]
MDPFLAIPVEIYYYILSYLDRRSKTAFAKCSRHRYFLAFPNRIRGIKITEGDEHEKYLDQFVGNGWLAPYAYCILSAELCLTNIQHLRSRLPNIVAFPNLTHLKISIPCSKYVEKNVYVIIFSLLSAAPFYDKLECLEMRWSSDRQSSFAPDPGYPGYSEEEQRENYDQKVAQLTRTEKDILGPFISDDDPALSSIRFPKHLQTLNMDIATGEVFYLWPLVHSESSSLTTLHITNVRRPVMDHRVPSTVCKFPSIKTLNLRLYWGYNAPPDHLPQQYPNLESLTISCYTSDAPGEDWLEAIPNLPKLTYLELPFPLWDGFYPHMKQLERELEDLITEGHFPVLREVGFVGGRFGAPGLNIKTICMISADQSGSFRFAWCLYPYNRQDNWLHLDEASSEDLDDSE